jgi:hypothetical protein
LTKGRKWPTADEEIEGRRFVDPCAEDFYVEHCVPELAGALRWITECGRFTIDAIRLNRDTLRLWRESRDQAVRNAEVIRAHLAELTVVAEARPEIRTRLDELRDILESQHADLGRFYGLRD